MAEQMILLVEAIRRPRNEREINLNQAGVLAATATGHFLRPLSRVLTGSVIEGARFLVREGSTACGWGRAAHRDVREAVEHYLSSHWIRPFYRVYTKHLVCGTAVTQGELQLL